MLSLPGKFKVALQAIFGLPSSPPATLPAGTDPEDITALLKAIGNELVTLNNNGVKTLRGATSRTVADTALITNTFGSSFLLIKLVIREVVTIDDEVAHSLGVTGTPQRYSGILNLLPSDFTGGNTVTLLNFGSGIPVAAGSDFLVTAGGPATIGELEYTLIGVLI